VYHEIIFFNFDAHKKSEETERLRMATLLQPILKESSVEMILYSEIAAENSFFWYRLGTEGT